MKSRVLYVLALFLTFGIQGYSQSPESNTIKKETFIYSIKDQDSLRLDKYDLPSLGKDRPCVIFAFGGGFVRGDRASKRYVPFFHQLAKNGYSVVSIDYRLGLKKAIEKKKRIEEATKSKVRMDPQQGLAIFSNTIDMAVEDLYDATNYVIKHAKEWDIDTKTIVACGSSAGAITVLQGEYELCNKYPLSDRLSSDFRYAGIIAFAGAIFSKDGDLKWATSPAPMQLFHGDADKNVPYDKIEIEDFNLGFYGSKYIADKLEAERKPYYFYQEENAAHELADNPMKNNWSEIKTFLDKLVVGKQNLMINTKVKNPDKPEPVKDFMILDYMQANGLSFN